MAEVLCATIVASKIIWLCINVLKDFLRSNDQSLNDIPLMHDYLTKLQNDKFIFDCESTYIGYGDEELFVLACGRSSFAYRLDSILLRDPLSKWEEVQFGLEELLRVRNAIQFSDKLSDDPSKLIEIISKRK